ncbi:hypothetical protein F5J12DRAFT_785939 [Pisolithus orientalis]|uniref:uncharacterized protein n=1 Tax=Pisolithus orientalis TaxID=936130 RepID=UPI002224E87B|nr:uncharacterized protein F5J12DRAFT_785939 [Pisolithus orientalis]KAI5993818.1 hypothetical protein F5J12DRAFT_785939 [Pisolithus orientalis]
MVAPVFKGQNGHLPMLCNHGSFTMVWKTPAYIATVPYYTLQLPDNPSSTPCSLYHLPFLMAINHSATQDITHYMHQEFSSQTLLGPNAPKPDPPLYIPTHSIVAMNQTVASMHVAYNNRIILGTGNTIALWYLPSAITNDLQASLQTHMLATLDPLHHAMSKSMTSGSWWKNAEYFNHTSWSPGCLEFSLARHQQGHMVWLYYLRVSADLQMDASCEWSQQSYLPAAILSGALSIMHPGLYDTGRQAMQSLDTWLSQHNQDMHDALQHWPLSNWYDMLVTVGDYEDCVLDIPMLGLQFLYKPGTVVAFSGRLLQHGASSILYAILSQVIFHIPPPNINYGWPVIGRTLQLESKSSQMAHWEIGLLVVHKTMAYVPDHMDW